MADSAAKILLPSDELCFDMRKFPPFLYSTSATPNTFYLEKRSALLLNIEYWMTPFLCFEQNKQGNPKKEDEQSKFFIFLPVSSLSSNEIYPPSSDIQQAIISWQLNSWRIYYFLLLNLDRWRSTTRARQLPPLLKLPATTRTSSRSTVNKIS